jgi:protein phosphatase
MRLRPRVRWWDEELMLLGGRSRHATCSVSGRRRDNEDRAATLSVGRDCLVAVVADGMGGAKAGAVASDEAIRGFLDVARACSPGEEHTVLKDGFASADAALRNAAQPGREGMGTTLVAAIARGEEIWVGNIGDSRAVLVLPDEVIPLSAEHSVVGEALRAGEITEVEAFRHPYRHVVSRAMGDGDHGPELRFKSLRDRGDREGNAFVLLGTDGLFNHLGDIDLLDVAATSADVHVLVQKLVLRAIRNGSDDNVTAAALLLPKKRRFRMRRAVTLLIVVVMLLAVAVVSASVVIKRRVSASTHSFQGNGETHDYSRAWKGARDRLT